MGNFPSFTQELLEIMPLSNYRLASSLDQYNQIIENFKNLGATDGIELTLNKHGNAYPSLKNNPETDEKILIYAFHFFTANASLAPKETAKILANLGVKDLNIKDFPIDDKDIGLLLKEECKTIPHQENSLLSPLQFNCDDGQILGIHPYIFEKWMHTEMGMVPQVKTIYPAQTVKNLINLLYGIKKPFELTLEEILELIPYLEELNLKKLLNFCLSTGFISKAEQNPEMSLEVLEKASKEDNSYATLALGHFYLQGLIVKKQPQEALRLFQSAMDAGNTRAYCFMADYCRQMSKDRKQEKFYIEQAVESGCAEGYVSLGNLHLEKKDFKKAITYYSLAIEQHYLTGYGFLGFCYYQMEKLDLAIQQFKLAAANKFPGAMYNLGLCYYTGMGGIPKTKKGLYYIKKAADLNHPFACYQYGSLSKDPIAINYFIRGAELGNPECQFALGQIYKQSDHQYLHYSQPLERETRKAHEQLSLNNFKLAADQDYEPAILELVEFYSNIVKNKELAGFYSKKVADLRKSNIVNKITTVLIYSIQKIFKK